MIRPTRSIALVLGVSLVFAAAVASASHLKEQPRKHRVVYHLSEPGVEKAKAVLGNIVNHVNGVGGWENIEALELVVHGPALKTFVTTDIDPAVRGRTDYSFSCRMYGRSGVPPREMLERALLVEPNR